jgi:hypothetical protein
MHYKIPVRSITLFIFGGVSLIGAEPPSAAAGFWISIAGPAVSFILAAGFSLIYHSLSGIAPLLALMKYLVYINIALGVFNLIPGFPLDGGGIFRAIVWRVTHNMRKATLIAANAGRFIAYIFIFAGVWQIFAGNFINGIWIAFIGWFLENAAVAQIQQQALRGALAGHKVSQAMNPHYTSLAGDMTLHALMDEHILNSGRRSFIVERGNDVIGLLTLHQTKEVPRSEWPTKTVAQIMIPLHQVKRVQPDTELLEALEEMDRNGVNQLPVMTDGQIHGMLSREDIIAYLRKNIG